MTGHAFRPTHVVPPSGLPAWADPDPGRPTAPLDPLLPVQLMERRGDWGHVRCANGWDAWVDGRHLVAVPGDPPATAGRPLDTTDPRPLLARAERALAEYRSAVEELADGVADGEAFHARTRGLRIGVVVDGEDMWLYDAGGRQWRYGDGRRLSTYATDEAAAPGDTAEGAHAPDGTDGGSRHAPTRVVGSEDGF
ncbi:hypothetical protein [Streptomyces sp. NPDC006739]|uniref:hypothetical protein n=1 Tax=Streptomyces sp. NPDC006739 TaxID=3364763 RepID=UPI0036AAFD24